MEVIWGEGEVPRNQNPPLIPISGPFTTNACHCTQTFISRYSGCSTCSRISLSLQIFSDIATSLIVGIIPARRSLSELYEVVAVVGTGAGLWRSKAVIINHSSQESTNFPTPSAARAGKMLKNRLNFAHFILDS